MYRAAQWVVRHKVLVVAIGAAGFIFFGGNKEETKPANPWSSASASEVTVTRGSSSGDKKSLTDKAIGAVSGVAKEYVGVDIGGGKGTNDQNWAAGTNPTKEASE